MKKIQNKGRTLQMLQGRLKSAEILPSYIFSVDDWINKKNTIFKEIPGILGQGPWIVRSSHSGEDNLETSQAGAFASVLNVENLNLTSAIETVIESYQCDDSNEELFVQPMLEGAEIVGVAFSHDPNTGSPDRIINWSEGSNTQAVTAGLASNTWQISVGADPDPKMKFLVPVVNLIDELLSIFDHVPIDCEFAITRNNEEQYLWLLQVRPLILSKHPKSGVSHLRHLNAIKEKIKIGMRPKPFLMGETTVYGMMPDWNPAEIIGKRPKSLALSLYQDLITDSIWAYQRHNYGYRNLRSYPLMINLMGFPYVDVRVSFNSFIPIDLEDDLAGRLVDYYINKLISNPALHDKIEFEIVFSCYTPSVRDELKSLSNFGFSQNDQNQIAESLLRLTNNILDPACGLWRADAKKLETLRSKFQTVQSSNLNHIEKIYWLIEDCKRYGTLPFAGLARAAFIGMQILKSLVKLDILSEENYRQFMESVTTVSSEMVHDKRFMQKSRFLEKYGHLRPGTYDLLSKRYDAEPELYFSWNEESREVSPQRARFDLTKSQEIQINNILSENGIKIGSPQLFEFIRATFELREQAKFEFTRNLSEVLVLIEELGACNDIALVDLSFSNIATFRELYLSSADTKQRLLESIEVGKENYATSLSLSLPPLITKPDDVMSFEWPQTEPNFVTQKKVTAAIDVSAKKQTISNKIVFIPNADPGFDWIFSYPIAGFVTAWGGVNSHMAIRAGELGIPAVIGAGEILYNKWSKSTKLMIDCALCRVEIIE